MKKNILKILTAALLLNVNPAHAAADDANAVAFVKQVTENGVEDIINAKISHAQNNDRLPTKINKA